MVQPFFWFWGFFSKARILSLKCVLKGSFNDLEIINDMSSHLVLLWEIQGLFLVLWFFRLRRRSPVHICCRPAMHFTCLVPQRGQVDVSCLHIHINTLTIALGCICVWLMWETLCLKVPPMCCAPKIQSHAKETIQQMIFHNKMVAIQLVHIISVKYGYRKQFFMWKVVRGSKNNAELCESNRI